MAIIVGLSETLLGTAALDRAIEEACPRDTAIVIRRRSRVGKALLGSTAQDVPLGAECPVLGIKVPADVATAS